MLKRRDLETFIRLLPNWAELAEGLDKIVRAPGGDALGLHRRGVVQICAWESDLWWLDADIGFVDEHRDILTLLGVEIASGRENAVVKWSEGQARAFQLLHVFLHELGHHHDRVTTRSKHRPARGESYAETYAHQHFARIWDSYLRSFGNDLV